MRGVILDIKINYSALVKKGPSSESQFQNYSHSMADCNIIAKYCNVMQFSICACNANRILHNATKIIS